MSIEDIKIKIENGVAPSIEDMKFMLDQYAGNQLALQRFVDMYELLKTDYSFMRKKLEELSKLPRTSFRG